MLKEIGEFTWAVLEQLHGWISGGLLALAVELLDRIWDWKIPRRPWIAIFIVCGLVVSVFGAWREEHEKVLLKETRMKMETVGNYIPQPVPAFGNNHKTAMNFGIRNTGSFEAENEYTVRYLEVHDSATRHNHTEEANPTSRQIEDEVFAQLKKDAPKNFPKHSVDPGDKAYLTAWTTHPLLPDEIQELNAQDKLLYLIGFVDWTDGSGTHERTFCYWLHLPMNKGFVWDECLSHNDFLQEAKDF